MKKIYLLSLSLSFVALFGCKESNSIVEPPTDINTPAEINTTSSGRFAFSYMNGLTKVAVDSSDSVKFNLGDLRGTRSFYFIIENVGDIDIDSISLKSVDSSISITPDFIDVLKPKGQSSIIQTVKVTINDGTVLENGVGSTTLQPMGDITKFLNISGYTNDSLISINLNLTMKSYIMNADLFSRIDSSKLDYINYAVDAPTAYSVNSSDALLYFKNTGNTKLGIKFNLKSGITGRSFKDSTFNLYPNQSYDFSISQPPADTTNIGISDIVATFTITNLENTVYDCYKFTTDPRYPFTMRVSCK